jgi:hypothetical protein
MEASIHNEFIKSQILSGTLDQQLTIKLIVWHIIPYFSVDFNSRG